jgi:hypothetical protein
LLLVLVDTDYKFFYVNVGAAGRAGDAGVFNDSSLKKALVDNTLNFPTPVEITGISTKKTTT